MNQISRLKDKITGIPMLLTLGGLEPERKREDLKSIKSAGFLCLLPSRDLIFTLPVFVAFKYKFPNCKITIFVSEENAVVASLISEADAIVKIESESLRKSVNIIRATGVFDIWVDFGIWSRFEAILSIKAYAKYKIGFKKNGELRHFAYDRVADYDNKRHKAENISRLALLLGLKLNLTSAAIEQQFASIKPKSVVINIFADYDNEENRQWSLDNWKKLVESLFKKGYSISIVGDKSHVAVADKFVESLSSGTDIDYFVGRLDIKATMNLLLKNEVLVSIDAMPIYLARHVGVAVIGLFAPTYPLGTYFNVGKNLAIVAGTNCVGCQNIYGNEKCSMDAPTCMSLITVESVERQVLKICESDK